MRVTSDQPLTRKNQLKFLYVTSHSDQSRVGSRDWPNLRVAKGPY
jgi:hypothetical protein